MKNNLKLSCVFSTCLIALSANAASDSANITVTAQVVDNTCTPSWDTTSVNVQLGRVSMKDFNGNGSVAKAQPFDLKLTSCGNDTTKVSVVASGGADKTTSSLFANGKTDGAQNVGVGIYGDDTQSTQLLPDGTNSVEYSVDSQTHAADMKFAAKLMQSGTTTPTAGVVNTALTLTATYE